MKFPLLHKKFSIVRHMSNTCRLNSSILKPIPYRYHSNAYTVSNFNLNSKFIYKNSPRTFKLNQ